MESLYASFVRNIDQQQFCFSETGDGAFSDVLFLLASAKERFAADRVILAARSQFFYALFSGEPQFTELCGELLIDQTCIGNGREVYKVTLPSWVDKHALLAVLEFIYVGRLPRLSEESSIIAASKMLKLFQLPSLDKLRRMNESSRQNQLISDISGIRNPDRGIAENHKEDSTWYFDKFANVRILLESGVSIVGHQTILASRSDFFNAMLHGSRWMLARDNDGKVIVDLHHISLEVYSEIDRWMYSDTISVADNNDSSIHESSGFSGGSLDEYMDYIILLLASANELLLLPVIEMCGNILISKLDLTNALNILDIADTYLTPNLKIACLDFCKPCDLSINRQCVGILRPFSKPEL